MHFLTVDLTIAHSLICFQAKEYFFFWLANILYSFTKILVKMGQLKFVETGACLSTVNPCVLALQIYRPDKHILSDQIINVGPFLVKIYRFERSNDVLLKFVSKEIFKLFIFSLRTNLVCKTHILVCKISNCYITNLRCIEM